MAQVSRARAEFETYLKKELFIGTNSCSADPDAKPKFTPVTQLETYWSTQHIKGALGDDWHSKFDLQLIQERYIRVFSILVLLGFPTLIWDIASKNFSDRRLPFLRPPAHHWPPAVDFDAFYERQWQFCVQDFNRQTLMGGCRFVEEEILPYEVLECLGEGASSKVFLIKLNDQYNHLHDDKYPAGTVPDADKFVLKTYYTNEAKKYHSSEVRAFKQLMRVRDKTYLKNIITFYGSWTQGSAYNILLEYANGGTLEDYWKTTSPPSRKEDIAQFWLRLLESAQGLQHIHELRPLTGEEGPLVQGIHQDIKPSNILVVSVENKSDYGVVFKVADLGLSHFVATVRPGVAMETKDKFGTPMYSAPECCRLGTLRHSDLHVRSCIDVWSLGCVFSEAATWVAFDERGRKDYAQNRKSEIYHEHHQLIDAGYGDCFHDGNTTLTAVHKMHRRLRDERRVSDEMMENMIDLINNMIEPRVDVRFTAAQLVKTVETITARVRDKGFPGPFRTADLYKHPIQRHTSEPSPRHHLGNRISITHQRRNQNAHTPPTMHTAGNPSTAYASQVPTPLPAQVPENVSHSQNHAENSSSNFANKFNSIAEVEPSGLCIMQPRSDQFSGSPGASPPLQTHHRSLNGQRTVSFKSEGYFHSKSELQEDAEESDEKDYEHALPADQSELIAGPTGIVKGPGKQPKLPINRTGHNAFSTQFVSIKDALDWRKSGTSASQGAAFDLITSNLELLQGRDHVFLIDDSSSMKPSWKNLIEVFRAMANIVKHADPDGLDVFFAKSLDRHRGNKRRELTRVIEQKEAFLKGNCNMKEALQHVLTLLMPELDAPNEKRRKQRFSVSNLMSPTSSSFSKTKRGLSIYVLTDGAWEQGPDDLCGVWEPIHHVVSKLQKNQHIDTRVGIQFIRFGKDPLGKHRLNILDDGLQAAPYNINMDIVDTTRYDGNVLKMLLGAINRTWDSKEHTGVRGKSSHSDAQQNGYQTQI